MFHIPIKVMDKMTAGQQRLGCEIDSDWSRLKV